MDSRVRDHDLANALTNQHDPHEHAYSDQLSHIGSRLRTLLFDLEGDLYRRTTHYEAAIHLRLRQIAKLVTDAEAPRTDFQAIATLLHSPPDILAEPLLKKCSMS